MPQGFTYRHSKPTASASDVWRYVFSKRPRCPKCGSADHQTTRSIDGGDGSRTQRKRCRACGLAFLLIWE